MKRPPHPRSSFAISVALHVVLGAVLVKFLTFGPLYSLFDDDRVSAPVERIGFVALPQHGGPTQPGISGGDDRPERPKTAPPALVAPSFVPTGIPDSPAAAEPVEEGGSGPLIGRGGPLAGIRPSFSEPRVWVPPAPIVAAPKTLPERLDSTLAARIARHEDSLRLTASANRKPGDWTWERDGKKYGWDEKGIRLGERTIPSTLLSALAVNMQLAGAEQAARSPERVLRDRLAAEARAAAQRNLDESDFRDAVKAIRERKDRERREARPDGSGSSRR